MIDLLIRQYQFFSLFLTTFSRLKIDGIARIIIKLMAFSYMLLFHYIQIRKPVLKGSGNNNKIVVSLTTFPGRIGNVWMVIDILLRQSCQPDRIILWLSRDQFSSIEGLPRRLLAQVKQGLEIILVDGDIKSHKKYKYSLEMLPDYILITVDDDIFYGKNMIKDLVILHNNFPKSVIAHRALLMNYESTILKEYSSWSILDEAKRFDKHLFFTSGGGTLFPPNTLHDLCTNTTLSTTLAPHADDVWLNAMVRLNKTTIIKSHYSSTFLPIINFSSINLSDININQNKNDMQIKKVREKCIELFNIDPFSNS